MRLVLQFWRTYSHWLHALNIFRLLYKAWKGQNQVYWTVKILCLSCPSVNRLLNSGIKVFEKRATPSTRNKSFIQNLSHGSVDDQLQSYYVYHLFNISHFPVAFSNQTLRFWQPVLQNLLVNINWLCVIVLFMYKIVVTEHPQPTINQSCLLHRIL